MANRKFFYTRIAITATAFPDEAQITFPFLPTRIMLVAAPEQKPNQPLSFSFSNPHLDGELFAQDAALVFEEITESKLWMMVATGSLEVRVWAWRR